MLKEQVITHRGGRGGGGRGSGGDDRVFVTTEGRAGKIVQRPTTRRGGKVEEKRTGQQQRAKAKRGAWSKIVAWSPFAAKALVAVCVGVVLFKGYRAAAASTFFELRSVDVSGVSQASEDQIKQIVRRTTAATGVWKADLGAVSAELERQPWVRTAVVTRVLPSGLRVRITERVPRLVVRTNAGRFVWVDDDGVVVGGLTPAQQQPAFFMRGFDESGKDTARAENRERVKTFMTLMSEWETAGIAARVSELNLDDLRDVRAQLAGDDSQIEVRLGREDWTKRLGQALEKLDEQRQTPRGAFITYIDMTQGKRAVLGFNPHAQQAATATSMDASGANEAGAASNAGVGAGTTANDAAVNDATANVSDQNRRVSPDARGAARVKIEARAAKSKSKSESKSKTAGARRDERKSVERAASQSDGGGRPRRVTKGE
jgi:cell division septal protein FtsQ